MFDVLAESFVAADASTATEKILANASTDTRAHDVPVGTSHSGPMWPNRGLHMHLLPSQQ